MSLLLDLLSAPAVLVLALCAGAGVISSAGARTATYALAIRGAAGVVVLYVLLLVLGLLGVTWTRWSVLGPMLLIAGIGAARSWRDPLPRPGRIALPGWGDAMALAGLGGLAALLLGPALTMPDVVFHWGIKAHRYLLAGGIDYDFLSRPWNMTKHADYPNLVPGLYAAAGLVRGRFTEATFLPWTIGYLALIFVGAREAFARRKRFTAQATIAITLMTTIAFAIAHMLGGSPDLLIAGVMTAAIPAVLGAPNVARDRQVAVLAALGAGAKYEGGPLAVLLIAARLWQRWRVGQPANLAASLRLAWPSVVVAGLWWLEIWRFDLGQGNRTALFDPSQAQVIFEGVLAAICHPHWRGLAWVVVLVPGLLLARHVRPMAAVVLAQLGLYGWVYFTTPLAVDVLVATSAERLLLHAVPATFVLSGMVLAGEASAGRESAVASRS